jgi:uncharacterized protein
MNLDHKLTTYHLSHIDLDGYSCQLVTAEIIQNIHYYNANYGAEVIIRLREILQSIDSANEPCNILISDLNLTLDEAKFLEKAVNKRNEAGMDVNLLLLDHHGSGQDSADAFEWYRLDVSRCATKIVYEHALEHWDVSQEIQAWLAPFVAIVNAVDIWLMHEEENFEYGKVCLRLVSESRELNRYIFDKEDRAYKFALLKEAAQMAEVTDAAIVLDEKVHSMKKKFFRVDKNNTLDGLATAYIVKLIETYKEKFTIFFKGHKGILTFSLGNTSIIGNGILRANDDVNFVIDVGGRGTLSLRADDKIDVSVLAKELAGGGGHPNASGGRLKHFKDKFIYEDVKEHIETLLKDIEPKSKIPLFESD